MSFGLRGKPAHAGERVRHRVAKHVDEDVRGFRRRIGGRRERSDYRNCYGTAGDLTECLTRRACRGHAVGDNAIYGSPRTRHRDAEAAAHETPDLPIARPMAFGIEEETRLAAIDPIDRLDQGPQFSARSAGPLRYERKSCKSRQRRNAWNSAPVPVAGRNDRLGTGNQRDANRDVEDRLMVHHYDAAFPRDGAVNREPDASHYASHPNRRAGVEPQPRADDCCTIAW